MEKTKVDKLKEMMKAKKDASDKKSNVEQKMDEKMQKLDSTNPDDTVPEGSAEDIESQIKAAENEAKSHYDKLLRVMAEFENFKKRIERERMEQAKYANQALITEILPVLDDLDRVFEHLPQEASNEVKTITDGVRLVQNHLLATLSKHGLAVIEAKVGEAFDPAKHEAVAHIASKDAPEGTVAMGHRKGYQLNDRLIRAAMVSVSRGDA
jgi:molecular chaperone GrpE